MIYKRLLEPSKLPQNYAQPLDRAMDVREYEKLVLDMRVLKDGTDGSFSIFGAMVNEPEAYFRIDSTTVDFGSGAKSNPVTITDVPAFIRVMGENVTGEPICLVDVIGRP